MGKWIGRRGNLGLAKETVRGTPTVPSYWLPYEELSFDDRTEKVVESSAFGVIADSENSVIVNRYAMGGVRSHLEDKAEGLILLSLLGAVNSTGGPTNYVHTYTDTDTNQHQSLSLALQNPNETKICPLGVVDTYEITVEPNGFVSREVSFIARGGRDWATLSPSYTARGNTFLHHHTAFKVATNIAGLAAASAIALKSLRFTVNKNAVQDPGVGTVSPDDIVNQEKGVSGEILLTHEDVVWRDYLLNGTAKAIELRFTYGTNNYLYFQLPRVTFEGWELDGNLSEVVRQRLTFKAHYDAVNGQQQIHTAVLANQVASY
jgi:hypothetical protein